MLPRCEWSDPLANPDWDVSLTRWPDATPFHASPWLRTLAEAYGHRFHSLDILAGPDRPASRLVLGEVRSPVLGSRLVALPFTDCAPPLGGGGAVRWVQAACDHAARLRCRYVEFRELSGLPDSAPSFRSYWAHELDLTPGESQLWSGLAPAVRTALRRAEKAGITIRILQSADAVAAYYSLHCVTRQRHGAPPQPWKFFAELSRHVIVTGHGFVVLGFAPGDETPCAGALFLSGFSRAIYKFGASNERGRALRVNNLVMWRAIQHLAGVRCSRLHFGRTDLDQPGLRRFKLGWGAEELPLRYYRVGVSSGSYQVGHGTGRSWLTRLFHRLPLAMNRAAGRLLYGHLH